MINFHMKFHTNPISTAAFYPLLQNLLCINCTSITIFTLYVERLDEIWLKVWAFCSNRCLAVPLSPETTQEENLNNNKLNNETKNQPNSGRKNISATLCAEACKIWQKINYYPKHKCSIRYAGKAENKT